MLVIGHRGASQAAAENTAEAFRLADEFGADGVELDVRRAPDGRLLVKHDPLPPVVDGLPDLSDILTACGDMLVNVEIKNSPEEPGYDPSGAVVASTIDVLRRHGEPERWIVSSFDWETVQRFRELAPDIGTAFLVSEVTAETVERTAAAGHVAVHPWEPTITADLVERCHAAGLAVNTWTCNDPVRLRALADLGVDAVCTDVPDVALTALGRRTDPATRRWGTRA